MKPDVSTLRILFAGLVAHIITVRTYIVHNNLNCMDTCACLVVSGVFDSLEPYGP